MRRNYGFNLITKQSYQTLFGEMPGINDTYFAQRLRIGNRPDLFLFSGDIYCKASSGIKVKPPSTSTIRISVSRELLSNSKGRFLCWLCRHFTKVDDLITETVAISQHPNVRRNDIFMPDFFFLQQFAIRMCIYQHLFVRIRDARQFFRRGKG